MRIGHQQVAVDADRQSRRATRLLSGRLPDAEEVAVRVEDLDPRGHVADVEAVLGVDGHRPRLLKTAVRNAVTAEDLVQLAQFAVFVDAAASDRHCQYERGES